MLGVISFIFLSMVAFNGSIFWRHRPSSAILGLASTPLKKISSAAHCLLRPLNRRGGWELPAAGSGRCCAYCALNCALSCGLWVISPCTFRVGFFPWNFYGVLLWRRGGRNRGAPFFACGLEHIWWNRWEHQSQSMLSRMHASATKQIVFFSLVNFHIE